MILTINIGSSSIKFALYKSEDSLTKLLYGEMESIEFETTKLSFYDVIIQQKDSEVVKNSSPENAAMVFIGWLQKANTSEIISNQ